MTYAGRDWARRWTIGATTVTVDCAWEHDDDSDLSYLEQECFNVHSCNRTDDDGNELAPEIATCGTCGVRWSFRCQPTPASLCPRCKSFNRGEWDMLGCQVCVSLRVGPWSMSQTDSLWGIESDSGKDYLYSVERDVTAQAFTWVRLAIEQQTSTPTIGQTRKVA